MPEAKNVFRIQTLTIEQINLALTQIANRFDYIEGYRGNPTFYGATTFDQSEIKYTDENGTVLHSFGGI